MKPFSADEAAWSARLAADLRATQAGCSEEDPADRVELLQQKIADGLRGVAPSRRDGYLDALRDAFPDFARPAAATPAPPRPPEPFPTPEMLLASLLEAAPGLPPETRADFGRRLAAAGFATASAAPAPAPSFDLPGEIRARLSLPSNQPIDSLRALRLFGLLTELVIGLDQLAWSVWKQLAPHSAVRRDSGYLGDFRKLAALYLSGDPEVASPQLVQALDKTRKLIAGLLAGMGPAGTTFARGFLARFSPEAIENRAGGGFFTGGEQRSWRAYVEMFGQLTELSVGADVLTAIVQYAESAILGPNRPPAPTGGPPPGAERTDR